MRHTAVTIHARTLDLAAPTPVLLTQVATLAATIAATADSNLPPAFDVLTSKQNAMTHANPVAVRLVARTWIGASAPASR